MSRGKQLSLPHKQVVILYRAAGPVFWAGDETQDMVYRSPSLSGKRIAVLEDGPRDWLTRYIAEADLVVADPYDALASTDALLAYLDRETVRPVGIVTFAEEVIVQHAQCAAALGVLGPAVDSARRTSADKVRMKAALVAAGVPTPDYRIADSAASVVRGIEEIGPPAVIKPSVGGGSIGVYKVCSSDEAGQRVDCLLHDVRSGADVTFRNFQGLFLVERFVPGVVLSVDGVVHDQPFVCGMTGTVTEGSPLFLQKAAYSPPLINAADAHACCDVACAAVMATGIRDCAFHCELILSRAGPVVLEVAARAPGGYLTELYRHVYGVDLIAMLFRLACEGGPPSGEIACVPLTVQPRTHAIALSVFPTRLGTIREYPQREQLHRISCLVDCCMQPVGTVIAHPAWNVADALLVGGNRKRLWEDCSAASVALAARIMQR